MVSGFLAISEISVQFDLSPWLDAVDCSCGPVASPRLDSDQSREADTLRGDEPEVEAASPARQFLAVDFDAGDAEVKVDGLDPDPPLGRASPEPDLGRPVDKLAGAVLLL